MLDEDYAMKDGAATPPRGASRRAIDAKDAAKAALALALACVLGPTCAFPFLSPRPAWADPVQVSLSVPTEVPCAVLPDGTVVGPSSWTIRSDLDAPASLASASVEAAPEELCISAESPAGAAAFSFSDGQTSMGSGFTVPARGEASLSWDFSKLDSVKNADVLAASALGAAPLCDVSLAFACEPVAFAVYSDDDSSLRFYKRQAVPDAGSVFEGRIATEVYTGFEGGGFSFTAAYSETSAPWNGRLGDISTVVVEDDGIKPASLNCWFACMSQVESMDLAKLDTSACKNFQDTFFGLESLESLILSDWDTGSAQNLSCMFQNCYSLRSLDISGWDTSSVYNFFGLLYSCSSLTEIEFGPSFTTANAWNISSMFGLCASLENLDVSNWDLSSATDTSRMFYGCSSLRFLDVSAWNTSNVTKMSGAFGSMSYGMFGNCPNLTADCSNWDVEKVTDHTCFNLNSPGVTLPLPWQAGAFAVYSADDNSLDFYKRSNCELPGAGSTWNGKTATEVYTGFIDKEYGWDWEGDPSITMDTTLPWNSVRKNVKTVSVIDDGIAPFSMKCWFAGFTACKSIEIGNLDTSGVRSYWATFARCKSLKSFDASQIDTSAAITLRDIFWDCSSLRWLDFRSWHTSQVANMWGLVTDCSSLEAIDMSTIDMSNVTDSSHMLAGLHRLRVLKVGNKVDFGKPQLAPQGDQTVFTKAPSADYIDGADGKWYAASDGTAYTGAQIPASKADTYYAVAPSVFAVYSDTDNSLDFYNRAGRPNAGDWYEEKSATAVYTGFETLSFTHRSGDVTDHIPCQAWGEYATSVNTVKVVDSGIRPISMDYWFYCFSNMTACDITRLDTSECTGFSCGWLYCFSLKSIDLSTLDTSSCVDFSCMFDATGLESIDVTSFDVSKGRSFSVMFAYNGSLKRIEGLENWAMPLQASIHGMFLGDRNLTNGLGCLANWDVSSVSNIDCMFQNCERLNLDLSSWTPKQGLSHEHFNEGAPGIISPKAWSQDADPSASGDVEDAGGCSSPSPEALGSSEEDESAFDRDATPNSEA